MPTDKRNRDCGLHNYEKANAIHQQALIINCGSVQRKTRLRFQKTSLQAEIKTIKLECDEENERKREKERCSGSYHQAVGFLVIKDDSISVQSRLARHVGAIRILS